MISGGLIGQVVYLHVVELASFGVGYEALEDVLILDINNREGHTCLFDDVWESITWDRLGLLTLFDSITYRLNNVQLTTATQSYRGADAEGAAAASAALDDDPPVPVPLAVLRLAGSLAGTGMAEGSLFAAMAWGV